MRQIQVFSRLFFINFIVATLFLLPAQSAFAQGEWLFVINGLVKDIDNKRTLDGASVQITNAKTGAKVQTMASNGSGRFNFQCEPNKEYHIKVCKNGYVCKIISVSTMNVIMGEGVQSSFKFTATIELFQELKGVDYSVLDKPIGQIYYNETLKDFEWTADPFLRTKIEELEEAVKKKQKEELEQAKKAEQEVAKAAEEARKKAEEDAKNKQKALADAKKAEEEAKKRKLEEEEAARKKAESDAKKAAEEELKRKQKEKADAEAEAKRKLEEETKKRIQERKESEEEARKRAQEEAKNKELAEAEELQRKKEEAKRKSDEEAAARAEAKAAADAKRKAELEARQKALDEAKRIYVKSIDYQTEEGTNYIMTKTIITFINDEVTVYRKIIYNWGHTYYKRDTFDTTAETFNAELKKYTVKVD